ncbi:hypothetical protein [Halorussus caseinilyticus]
MSPVNDTTTVDDLSLEYDEEVEQRILGEVESATLPPKINDIVQDDGVLGDRKLFTWKWMWYVCGDMLTLDCVGDKHRQDAAEAKTLMALYTTLMDDIAEKLGDEATFWELAKTAYPESEPDWEREDIDSELRRQHPPSVDRAIDHLESAPRFRRVRGPVHVQPARDGPSHGVHADVGRVLRVYELRRDVVLRHAGYRVVPVLDYRFDVLAIVRDGRLPGVPPNRLRTPAHVATRQLGHDVGAEIYEGDYSTGIIVEALNRGIIDGAEPNNSKLER